MILEKQAVIASLYKYKDNLQVMLNNMGQARVMDSSVQSISSFESPEQSQQEEAQSRSKDELMEDQDSEGVASASAGIRVGACAPSRRKTGREFKVSRTKCTQIKEKKKVKNLQKAIKFPGRRE